MRMCPLVSVFMFVVCWLGGCATYEFAVVEPIELSGRLTAQERVLERDSIAYHMVSQSDRIAVRNENRSDEPLLIKGDESFMVTPDGESESLRSGTIAPGSWTSITVPPVIRSYEPRGGMHVGVGVGSWHRGAGGAFGVGSDLSDTPRDESAWRWKQGLVRLQIVLVGRDDSSARLEHDFVLLRRRIP